MPRTTGYELTAEAFVARKLAPAGPRSGPQATYASITGNARVALRREQAPSPQCLARSERLSVVGVFFLRMVGHVAYALEFRDALEQCALDAFLQGDVGLAAALAAAAELEHGDAVFHHVDQRYLAAVAGQPRVYLGFDVIIY